MISSFDKDSLFSLIKDLYTVIGIRISIFDDDFKMVTEYPVEAPEICDLIRTSSEGLIGCKQCDEAACQRAKKLHEPHAYKCHAGITEIISPIRIDGAKIGYAIFAHLLPDENYDESIKNICENCAKYGFDEARVKNAVRKLKTHRPDKIMASVRLLDAIASYLQSKKIASWTNEDISVQIKLYIDKHLGRDINSDLICKQFYISRTKLYQLSVKAFGTGISKYILSRRIEKAKELLSSGKYSVAGVAKSVGIDDYNYFCKLFKRQTGAPPSSFIPKQ